MTDTKFCGITQSQSWNQIPNDLYYLDATLTNSEEPIESYVRRHLLFGKLSELQNHSRYDARTYKDFLETLPNPLTTCGPQFKPLCDTVAEKQLEPLLPICSNQLHNLNNEQGVEENQLSWFKDWMTDVRIKQTIEEESKKADIVPHIFAYKPSRIPSVDNPSPEHFKKVNSMADCNTLDYLRSRELHGYKRNFPKPYRLLSLLENNALVEDVIPTGDMNKVFCSTWLDDNHVFYGTKSSDLCVYNTFNRKTTDIPILKSHQDSLTDSSIHTASCNPSRTFLLTQGNPVSSPAVYKLPTLDPFCIGQDGHSDTIFDSCWLDDNYFCSVSRDKTVCIWKVEDNETYNDMNYDIVWPRGRQVAETPDKLRTLAFNNRSSHIVSISSKSMIFVWDASTMDEILSDTLGQPSTCMCMATHPSGSLFASSAYSHVRFFDSRTYKLIHTTQDNPNFGQSIPLRSLNFQGDIVSIGYGDGFIMFYDIRAHKLLDQAIEVTPCHRSSSPVVNLSYSIYTHSYDTLGTKMFIGGGPLCYLSDGCYASIWK